MPQIGIADKVTLDLIKDDTSNMLSSLVDDATYVNTLSTVNSDASNVVVNISGSGELLALYYDNTGTANFRIQLDEAENRIDFYLTERAFIDLNDKGFKFNTSLKVTASVYNTYAKAFYKLT